LDLHERESQLCVPEDGGRVAERPLATSRERLTVVLGNRPPATVPPAPDTESAKVARHLEALGLTAIADPDDAPRYATRSRRSEADERDAHAGMGVPRSSAEYVALRGVALALAPARARAVSRDASQVLEVQRARVRRVEGA
jgi:hypothetical protein